MRYLIVCLLPKEIESQVRESYLCAFNEPITIKQLHLSLLPPFYLNIEELKIVDLIKNLKLKIENYSFAKPKLYTAGTTPTLALPLIPAAPLHEINSQLTTHYSQYVNFDLSVYRTSLIPSFDPHISLSYNFNKPDNLSFFQYPKSTFKLSPPHLLQELMHGTWELVA